MARGSFRGRVHQWRSPSLGRLVVARSPIGRAASGRAAATPAERSRGPPGWRDSLPAALRSVPSCWPMGYAARRCLLRAPRRHQGETSMPRSIRRRSSSIPSLSTTASGSGTPSPTDPRRCDPRSCAASGTGRPPGAAQARCRWERRLAPPTGAAADPHQPLMS